MEYSLSPTFLMVTTKNESGDGFPKEFVDNQKIRISKVILHDKYPDSFDWRFHRKPCQYKKVVAITDVGIEFLLWDSDNNVSNARQSGITGIDPATWGRT